MAMLCGCTTCAKVAVVHQTYIFRGPSKMTFGDLYDIHAVIRLYHEVFTPACMGWVK